MKKNKVPEIRFSGFTDDWEQRKLGEFTKLITKGTTPKDKSSAGNINFVKVENLSNGKITPLTRILQDEHDGYLKRSKLEENDILFSIAGTLGRTAIVNKEILPANTNQALAIIRGYKFDTNFLITSLNGHVVAEYIRKNPTVGAQPNLSLEQVGNLQINTPTVLEQQKIGSFFKKIDDTIDLHQRELEILKNTKKAFLQKMFPKYGEKVPEVRFPGFTDDWEHCKLNKLAKFSKGKGYTKNDLKSNGKEIILYGRLYTKYETEITNIDTFVESDAGAVKSEPGDVIVPASGETSKDISRASVVVKEGIILGGDLNIIKTKNEELSPVFLSLTISNGSQQKELIKRAQGKSVVHLHNSDLEKVSVNMPSIEEQQKIGVFFKKLDNTIALHQRELTILQKTKKAFLQKMFV